MLSALIKPALCGLLFLSGVANGTAQLRDFDTLWSIVKEQYTLIAVPEIAARWDCVRDTLRPRITSTNAVAVLSEALDALTDGQVFIDDPTVEGWRRVPSGSDMVAEFDSQGRALVREVRARTPAMRMGVRPGDEIIAINGITTATAARAVLPACVAQFKPAAQNWALQRIISGKKGASRAIEFRTLDGRARTLYLAPPHIEKIRSAIRRLPSGVIVVPLTALGEPATLKRLDVTLRRTANARAIILDLREAADDDTNGPHEAAILGKFVARESNYLRVQSPGQSERRLSTQPSGKPAISAPVAVVVGPWTAGAGIRLALGLHTLRAAPVIGGRMSAQSALLARFTLPSSGLQFTLPTQKIRPLDMENIGAFTPIPSQRNDYGTDLVFNEAVRALALPPAVAQESAK